MCPAAASSGPSTPRALQRRRDHRPHRPPRPSRILSATARPSGAPRRTRPPPPSFAISPGTAAASRTTSRPVPATHHGCARSAAATRPSGVSGGAVAMRANARASPAGVLENSGAPQPSTAMCAMGTPVRSSTVSAPPVADSDRDRGRSLCPNLRRGRSPASRHACRSSSGRGRKAAGPPPATGRPHPGRAGGRGCSAVVDAEAEVPQDAPILELCGSPEWLAAAGYPRPVEVETRTQHGGGLERLDRRAGKKVTSGSPTATARAPWPSTRRRARGAPTRPARHARRTPPARRRPRSRRSL